MNNIKLFHQIIQTRRMLRYAPRIYRFFLFHSQFGVCLRKFGGLGPISAQMCQYAHHMLYEQNPTNFEFHKKFQKLPKRLKKIVYFCPKIIC
jgi:hypothetical protein